MRTDGFTLIEIILALTIASVAIMVFIGGVLYGSDTLTSRYLRLQARLYASECLHVTRWLRETGGLDALETGVHGLSRQDGTWQLSGSEDTDGTFTRSVTIAEEQDHARALSCSVTWQGQFGQRQVVLETRLATWNDQ